MNMVICKIGTAAGTATTGDVIVIPATQSAPDAATTNNPLPEHGSVSPFPSSASGIKLAALNGGNKFNMAIIAGSDEYLGLMTHISDADTDFGDICQVPDLTGTDNNLL